MFVVCSVLCVDVVCCYVWFVDVCLLRVVSCRFVVGCVLFVGSSLCLLVVCCCGVAWSLFVECCLLVVVCCVLLCLACCLLFIPCCRW